MVICIVPPNFMLLLKNARFSQYGGLSSSTIGTMEIYIQYIMYIYITKKLWCVVLYLPSSECSERGKGGEGEVVGEKFYCRIFFKNVPGILEPLLFLGGGGGGVGGANIIHFTWPWPMTGENFETIGLNVQNLSSRSLDGKKKERKNWQIPKAFPVGNA